LVLLGAAAILRRNTAGVHYGASAAVVALVAILFLPAYLPLSKFLPQARYLWSYRLPLLAAPFVAFAMGFGFLCLTGLFNAPRRRYSFVVAGFVIMVIVCFLSSTVGSMLTDCPDIPTSTRSPSKYFTNAELSSFSFLNNNGRNDKTVYSDYFAAACRNILSAFQSSKMLRGMNLDYIDEGYIVLRTGEFERKGVLMLATGNIILNYYRDPATLSMVMRNIQSKQVIYTNNDVRIMFVP
jgi:uncharacterized membrane protein